MHLYIKETSTDTCGTDDLSLGLNDGTVFTHCLPTIFRGSEVTPRLR